ncbi:substrate-binding periplasmic protein [Algicola sagamiensis]|uniref:substrate-binding periplasmic protein n=1 Tax=Algicola sagamiensis TaxID=163869 RepID=UPI0003804D18|nr:transporter substrate-binding domain-containing protein [Algicola sagamiensis]
MNQYTNILLGCCFLQTTFALGAEKQVVLANDEAKPFIAKEYHHFGVIGHILTQAFLSQGIKPRYEWMTWKRAYQQTLAGKYDATSMWIPTEERMKHFLYSDILLENEKVFFHLKSYPFEWKTIEDLKHIRIGAVLGFTYGPEFDKAVKEKHLMVERVATEKQNFELLLKGRTQIYPQELAIGQMYISLYPEEIQKQFTYHHRPIMRTTHHLLFSKKIPNAEQLLEAFNRGLKQLKDTGKLKKMLQDHQSGDYQKPKESQ